MILSQKRTCGDCRATVTEEVGDYRVIRCTLGHTTGGNMHFDDEAHDCPWSPIVIPYPLEPCYKPVTWAEFNEVTNE